MTAILGLSAFYHDSAAALVVDGELIAAVQEERFSRIKYDEAFPIHSIEWCLQEAGLRPEDLDYVGFYEKPYLKFERILESHLASAPRSFEAVRPRHADLAEAETLDIERDRSWAREGLHEEDRLRRTSRVARGRGLLSVALRRVGGC